MLGLAHRGFSLDDPDQHLASYLSKNGVETILAGQQHEAHDATLDGKTAGREILGYDRTIEGNENTVDSGALAGNDQTARDIATARATANLLRNRDTTEPFFLSVGLYNTHQPMPVEQNQVDPDNVRPPAPLPDVEPVRREMAAYHVLAEYVDQCVGMVVDALETSGYREETLVVFTTDHGIPFPYMKCDLRDGGIGVSLITSFPHERSSDCEDALVSTMDLYPTFCSFLDVPIPQWVEGHSLTELVKDSADTIREEVFSEVTYHAAYEPKRCIRTRRYKYIRRFDDDYTREVGPNTDDGPSKRFLTDRGYLEYERPREALYDLYHDPNERDNLAEDSKHDDIRTTLSDRLEAWMESTEDPLLNGPVSKPDGAFADCRDGVDPGGEHEPPDAR
jgi:arylsulfatase A-like enzyme